MFWSLKKVLSVMLSLALALLPVLGSVAEEESSSIEADNSVFIEEVQESEPTDVPVTLPEGNDSAEETGNESIQSEQTAETFFDDAENEQIEEELPAEEEEAVTDVDAAADFDVETVQEEISDDDVQIVKEDYTSPISEISDFHSGYATMICDSAVFAEMDLLTELGTLKSGIVKVIERVNNVLEIRFVFDGAEMKGYVSARNLRYVSDEEVSSWKNGGSKVVYLLSNVVEETLVEGGEPVDEPVDLLADVENDDSDVVIEEIPLPEEFVEVFEDINTDDDTVQVETLTEDDEFAPEETDEDAEEQEDAIEKALPTDVQLNTDVNTRVGIPTTMVSDGGGKAYAYYEMASAGLLTITFKSITTDAGMKAYGNVTRLFAGRWQG